MVAVTDSPRRAAVERILGRYLVEIVERHDLCPWARSTREGGEVAIDVVWGTAPTDDSWVAAAQRMLDRPETRVAMIVAPELDIDPSELRDVRSRIATRVPTAGVADFHPDAPLDLTNPARLVPFVRRAPDPLIQLVPFAILDAVRTPQPLADRAQQALLLRGHSSPPPRDVAARIAALNHARVSESQAEILATLDDIRRDRRESYARVGISTSR